MIVRLQSNLRTSSEGHQLSCSPAPQGCICRTSIQLNVGTQQQAWQGKRNASCSKKEHADVQEQDLD